MNASITIVNNTLNNEINTRANAVNNLNASSSALTFEINRATAAENLITTNLNIVNASIASQLSDMSYLNLINTSLANEILRAKAAEALLNSSISQVLVRDGTSSFKAGASCAGIKLLVASVTSGVKWLIVASVNNGAAFQIWCDYTINGGLGYAIVYNNLFVGSQAGPASSLFGTTTLSGTADKFNVYLVSPNQMFNNYNSGITQLAVFCTTNDGTTVGGIQSSSTYRWVSFSGVTPAQYINIWSTSYSSNQFTGNFVANNGNSGTAYFPNAHGNSGGVTQISTNGGAINNYILYEYNANGGTDPNHFFEVLNGGSGDLYFVANPLYSGSNVLSTRWCGVAVY